MLTRRRAMSITTPKVEPTRCRRSSPCCSPRKAAQRLSWALSRRLREREPADPRWNMHFEPVRGCPGTQHDHQVFHGTERFYRSGYVANLVSNWIPSIAGAQESLTRGARVADIGCGHGASTLLMAEAFPNSRFFGFDSHAASIEAARERAAAKGLSERVQFAVAGAKDFPGTGYDLVTDLRRSPRPGRPGRRRRACPLDAEARWSLDDR